NKLKDWKSGEIMNVPKLRFKEFTDEWNFYKFEDIIKIKNGLNKEKDAFGFGTPIINYMDVNKNEKISKENIKGLVNANKNEISRFKVNIGDLLFTRTSETSDEIGLSASVIENINSCVFSGFILKGEQLKNNIHPYFGGYYFRNPKMRKEIVKHSSITTRALTSGTLLNQMKVFLPSIKEQEMIGKTLSLLDKKIELQTKKIEDLKLYKKGLIRRFFEEDDLKKITINDIGKIITGATPSKANTDYWDNGYIVWVTPTDISEERDINDSRFKITENGLNHGRFVPKNSILVTCIASIGKNAVLKSDGSCNQQINAIIPSNNYNFNYVYYLMNSISNHMQSIAGSSATSIINKDEFSKINVKVHNLEKQNYIDKVLSSFEIKISNEKIKLQQLNKLKKGLTQSMFV
ncbi:MAG: restriction endonuclease subunit S, partial [Bacilli bacterium]|nr:restriction endonuclease subunit S [Bacilli bacterium]